MTGLSALLLGHAAGRSQRDMIRAALRDRRTYDTLHCERCRADHQHTITAGPEWTTFRCDNCGKSEDYK